MCMLTELNVVQGDSRLLRSADSRPARHPSRCRERVTRPRGSGRIGTNRQGTSAVSVAHFASAATILRIAVRLEADEISSWPS